MLANVYSLSNEKIGTHEIPDEVFGLSPNLFIMHSVINWQRNKRRRGTHKTKTLTYVSGTGKKPFKQKGTGNARQGTLRSVHMRGGATVHGPVNRSHETDLPKKMIRLGLYHALSSKVQSNQLMMIEAPVLETHKSKNLASLLANFNSRSILIIGGDQINPNLKLASRNLPHITVLPAVGMNVYDIVKHDTILFSVEALQRMN